MNILPAETLLITFVMFGAVCVTFGGTAELVYGLIGKEVRLDPTVTVTLRSISWKKENDRIAEWDAKLYYYGRCLTAEQCELNPTTGLFIMKGLNSEDEGRYSAEINKKGPAKEFQLIVLKPVSKPRVTMSCNETQCTLTCVGEETKHSKYSWKENNETVKEGNTLMVEKSAILNKTHTCVFSNPKSEEESDPVTEEDKFPDSLSSAIIVVTVGTAEILFLGLVAVICFHEATCCEDERRS